MWTALASGAFALIGAGLGAVTTILIQRRMMVLEREKLRHIAVGRVNALSIAVFRDMLAATKAVERLAERRRDGETLDGIDVPAATSEMWLRWQEVAVFCPRDIRDAALPFVQALYSAAYHQVPEPWELYLDRPRAALFDVAAPIFQEQSDDGYAGGTQQGSLSR
ncbi:hypothetical protein ACFYTS_00055 [Nocardia sp. NPDC004151]|uniref:hypothetical protein n=1 Tax=Nocardia sp. NPDC004151 TaxID=3364304 RepID=UPI00368913B8